MHIPMFYIVLLLWYADCIGSAFNMKGAMQCPNCRKVEKGRWLYASGSTFSFPEFSIDDWTPDENSNEFSYSEMVSTTPMFNIFFLLGEFLKSKFRPLGTEN